MQPGKEQFVSDFMVNVDSMVKIMVDSSKILDYEGVVNDFEKYGGSLSELVAAFFFSYFCCCVQHTN